MTQENIDQGGDHISDSGQYICTQNVSITISFKCPLMVCDKCTLILETPFFVVRTFELMTVYQTIQHIG